MATRQVAEMEGATNWFNSPHPDEVSVNLQERLPFAANGYLFLSLSKILTHLGM